MCDTRTKQAKREKQTNMIKYRTLTGILFSHYYRILFVSSTDMNDDDDNNHFVVYIKLFMLFNLCFIWHCLSLSNVQKAEQNYMHNSRISTNKRFILFVYEFCRKHVIYVYIRTVIIFRNERKINPIGKEWPCTQTSNHLTGNLFVAFGVFCCQSKIIGQRKRYFVLLLWGIWCVDVFFFIQFW